MFVFCRNSVPDLDCKTSENDVVACLNFGRFCFRFGFSFFVSVPTLVATTASAAGRSKLATRKKREKQRDSFASLTFSFFNALLFDPSNLGCPIFNWDGHVRSDLRTACWPLFLTRFSETRPCGFVTSERDEANKSDFLALIARQLSDENRLRRR